MGAQSIGIDRIAITQVDGKRVCARAPCIRSFRDDNLIDWGMSCRCYVQPSDGGEMMVGTLVMFISDTH